MELPHRPSKSATCVAISAAILSPSKIVTSVDVSSPLAQQGHSEQALETRSDVPA
jgi:hypothetical protein